MGGDTYPFALSREQILELLFAINWLVEIHFNFLAMVVSQRWTKKLSAKASLTKVVLHDQTISKLTSSIVRKKIKLYSALKNKRYLASMYSVHVHYPKNKLVAAADVDV